MAEQGQLGQSSEVGGSEPEREIVSFSSCVCMHGLVVKSELGKKDPVPPLHLFPSDQEGSSADFCVVLVSPSEI